MTNDERGPRRLEGTDGETTPTDETSSFWLQQLPDNPELARRMAELFPLAADEDPDGEVEVVMFRGKPNR